MYAKPRVKPVVAPSAVAEVLVEVIDGHHAHAAGQAVVQFLANAAFKHLHNVGDGWVVGHGFLWMTRVFLRCSQEFPQCSRVFRRAPRKILRRAAVQLLCLCLYLVKASFRECAYTSTPLMINFVKGRWGGFMGLMSLFLSGSCA